MADFDDDVLLACSSLCVVCAAALLNIYSLIAARNKRINKRKHRVWISKYLRCRPQYGAYNSLMHDLLELDNTKFRNYIRMDPDVFEDLFIKVEPRITTKDTKFR